MKYDSKTRDIYYEDKLISCFYFRTLYSPNHFKTEKHWEVMETIEKSKALKIPSVRMQLVNSKRFQAEFSKLAILEAFIPRDEAELLHSLNKNIWDFEQFSNAKEWIEKTREEEYVLKPNRDGGGNNYFGSQVTEKLIEFGANEEELHQYILMKKIRS